MTTPLTPHADGEPWVTGPNKDRYCAGFLVSRRGDRWSPCPNMASSVYRASTGYLYPLCAGCAHSPNFGDMEYVRPAGIQ